MFGIIKKMIIALLSNIVNGCNHTKCILLSNQKGTTQPTLINLHPNEYSEEYHYYPFAVKIDKCVESCNTLNGLSNKIRVPNKTEDLNLSVFHMIKIINESKTLTKHISCECKCKFDGRKCNSNERWNNGKYRCECRKHNICEKDYIWNSTTCSCENEKYLASIMNDSAIIYNEVINADVKAKSKGEAQTMKKQELFQQILMKRKQLVKRKFFISYLHFY